MVIQHNMNICYLISLEEKNSALGVLGKNMCKLLYQGVFRTLWNLKYLWSILKFDFFQHMERHTVVLMAAVHPAWQGERNVLFPSHTGRNWLWSHAQAVFRPSSKATFLRKGKKYAKTFYIYYVIQTHHLRISICICFWSSFV